MNARWSSPCGSAETKLTSIMKVWIQSLAMLSGLRTQSCGELWCRLQMRLRSCVAMAVAVVQAGSYSFN